MFDFFLCSWAHVICCLWRFKFAKWWKKVGERGECMMGNVISVPLMGAASTLLIPGVIPAQPQQRSREHQCGQDEVLQCQQKPHSDVGVPACIQGYSNQGFTWNLTLIHDCIEVWMSRQVTEFPTNCLDKRTHPESILSTILFPHFVMFQP